MDIMPQRLSQGEAQLVLNPFEISIGPFKMFRKLILISRATLVLSLLFQARKCFAYLWYQRPPLIDACCVLHSSAYRA